MKRYSIAAVIIALVTAGFLSCNKESHFNNGINTNTIKLQKNAQGKISKITYNKAVTVVEDGIKKVCLCRALGFRIAQTVAEKWKDNVFRGHEIVSIETGWNSSGLPLFFTDTLGIPRNKIKISKKAKSNVDLTLKDNWFIIKFNNGKKITMRGTERLYSKRYLELRAALEKGEKDLLVEEALNERNQIEQKFRGIPFSKMFTVKYH